MRVAMSVALIFVVLSVGAVLFAASQRAEVIRHAANSTVVVTTETLDGYSLGSGTVIGTAQGYAFVLTCHHVIEDSIDITVRPTNNPKRLLNAFIELDEPARDLTLLVVKDLDLPVLPLATVNPQLYDTVYLVGAPNGEFGSASEGMITHLNYSIDSTSGIFWRVTNALVQGGISGGTAINTEGQLIGVPARGERATTQQGLLIPLPAIAAMVKGYAYVQ